MTSVSCLGGEMSEKRRGALFTSGDSIMSAMLSNPPRPPGRRTCKGRGEGGQVAEGLY